MTAFRDAFDDPGLGFDRAALLVGHELEATVDVARTLAALDALAAPLSARASRVTDAEAGAALLAEYLGHELGFHGNGDDYYAPDNSLLDRVLARRVGIPITLAVVYIAVGTRVGIEVDGIGFPGHFLIRVGGPNGVFQDPYHRGTLLDSDKLADYVARHVGPGASLDPAHLAAVDPRSLAIRMLTNLEAAYARRSEHPRAWVAADRLHALTSDDGYRRHRGLHALSMGSNALAIEDLAAYLAAHPNAPDHERIRMLVERARDATTDKKLN